MTITLAHRPPSRSPAWRAPSPACVLQATWSELQERRFDRLRGALARHGGFVPADCVSELLRAHWDQPVSRVARWIARREVVSVTWRSQVWLPLFQFERPSLDLVPAVAALVRELRPVYDDWELAEWFAGPHDALGGRVPAAEVLRAPRLVREAARRDRFVNRW